MMNMETITMNNSWRLSSYCPVSSNINTKITGFFGYPMNVYDQQLYSQYDDSMKSKYSHHDVYNCTALNDAIDDRVYSCSERTKCIHTTYLTSLSI